MNKKISKLLFELSKNSRITTKELGKQIKTSQQSSSYLIKQLKKKKIIQRNTTIVDAVKLGLTNVVVGLNYLNFDTQVKKEILDEIKSKETIVSIEETKQGADLIIEYASSNLSAFNKTHTELINKFHGDVETKFMFPVIVKHKYLKNYLTRKFDNKDIVLCGDRQVVDLSEVENSVLQALVKQPDEKLIKIAKTTGISVKSVVNIKRKLEKRFIIKGYSCTINHKKLGINRDIIFLKFLSRGIKDIDSFVGYIKYNKNVIKLIKLIGGFHIMLVVEEINETDILKEIRSKFPIDDYMIIKSENILKKKYLPIE